jgi:hypothetical protein
MVVTGWLYYTFSGLCICGAISWVASIVPFCRIAAELTRARRAGEANHIPFAKRGLPVAVIFTKDILPRVEGDRRRLVWAITAFVFFWASGMAVGIAFGPKHPW